jgi:drug/metabolite transporter (DMT)-like permease
MTKIFIILIVAAMIESVGVAYLAGGIKEVGSVREISAVEIARVVKTAATNVKVLLGMGLEAVFFGCLLYMLSLRDVSFVWPLTSLGFIFTTVAAQFILHETVSATRWVGILLIAVGAGLTGYSEAAKSQPPASAPVPGAQSTPFRPQ